MDKNALLLSLYAGRTIHRPSFETYFSPVNSNPNRYSHEVPGAGGDIAYELSAYIENDTVKSVDVCKIESRSTGHGRPITLEKNLTSVEWKYTYRIFDACFPEPPADEMEKVIKDALDSNVSYSGFTIKTERQNDVVFATENGSTVRLSKKRISQAIQYSHTDLRILYNIETVKDFSECLGNPNYESLFAILSAVKPETYPDYDTLLSRYRFQELLRAIENTDLKRCKQYEDFIKYPGDEILRIAEAVFKTQNTSLAGWFFSLIPDDGCNLNGVLGDAIRNDDSKFVKRILEKGLYDPHSVEDSRHSPMNTALQHPKFVPLLLKHGFRLSSEEYLLHIPLNRFADILQYHVHFGESVIGRLLAQKRFDLLQLIEDAVPQYCSESDLIAAYIKAKDFERFKTGIQKGWLSQTDALDPSLFEKIYLAGEQWTDFIIQQPGFDINQNDGELLMMACLESNFDLALYLLKNGANPLLKKENSLTVFESVTKYQGNLNRREQKKQEELCRYLLDHGVDPIMESQGTPSIFTHLMKLSPEFKQYLIDWLGTHNRINAFECQNNRELSAHKLLFRAIDPWSREQYDPVVLRKMLAYGANADESAESGDTIFLRACAVCGVEELKLLIDHGANIREVDEKEHTNGLFFAARYGQPKKVIAYLISLGLDVNNVKNELRVYSCGSYGTPKIHPAQSVLDVALENRNKDIITLLKENGAKTAEELK